MAILSQTSFSRSGNFFGQHRKGSHLYNEQDYLHYYGGNAPETIDWMHNVVSQTKAQAMIGLRSQAKSRINTLRKQMELSTIDKQTIESLLSGKMFEGVGKITPPTETETNINVIDGSNPETIFDKCRQIIQDANLTIDAADDFAQRLYQVTEKITGQSQAILQDYAASVIEEASRATKNKGIGTHGSTTAQAIIEAVLGKWNQSFFQTRTLNNQKLHTDVVKMLALAESLPEPSIKDTTYSLKRGKNQRQENAVKSEQVLREIQIKVLSWITEIEKVTSETAIAIAANNGNEKFLSELNKLNVSLKAEESGVKNVTIDFKLDPRLEELLLKQGGRDWNKIISKRSKADVRMDVTKDSVTTTLGVTVKDYKEANISNDGTTIYKASLDIQKGTPLLTALLREANISADKLHYVYQFAVGHNYEGNEETGSGYQNIGFRGNEGGWDQDWEDLMTYMARRMLLNALMGFKDSQDSAVFIAINGYIYTMENFLDRFIASPQSDIMLGEYLGDYGDGIAAGGLSRQTYVALNKWRTTSKTSARNKALAAQRSRELEPKVSKVMADTKLRISLNLHQMASMKALNI